MLELNIGQVSEKIIVTLNEFVTLTTPFYLFIFTHIETKQQVSFIKAAAQDESIYQYRYNQFDINTSVLFLNKPRGNWNYLIYEQTSNSNTDPAIATSLLETGKMILYPVTEFEFTKYNEPTSYKTYNG